MKIHNLFRLATPLFLFLPSSYCPGGEEGNAVAPVQAGQNAKDDWIDSGFVRGTTAIVGTIDLQQVQSIERLKQVLPPTQLSSSTAVFDRLLSSTQEITKSLGGSKVHFVVDIPGGMAHPPVCFFAQKNSSTDLVKLNAALETFSAGSAVLKGNYVVFLPYHSLERAEKVAIGDDIVASELPKFREALKALNAFPIQIAIHPPEYLWKTVREVAPNLPSQLGGGPSDVLTDGMQWTSIGIDLNNLRFESKVQSANPSSAQRFAQQLPVWLNHLAKWPLGDSTGSDMEKIVQLLSIEAKGDQVIVGVRGPDQLTRGSQLLVDALSKVSAPFQRRAKMDKMKNILLALHNYYAAMGSFPPNQNGRSPDGTPRLSWRVHILPFLGHNELYAKFKLDEPWDSPNNKKLLAEMPEEYKSHGLLDPERGTLPVGSTTFLAPAGNHTILGNNKPTLFANVTDGTSNTVAIVEVKPSHAVAWTSPVDYVYGKQRPSEGLHVDNDGHFLMAMADGSVRAIRNTISEEMLNFLFLMDDGNVIELPQ